MLARRTILAIVGLVAAAAVSVADAAVDPVKITFNSSGCRPFSSCRGIVNSVAEGVEELNALIGTEILHTSNAPFLGFHFDGTSYRGDLSLGPMMRYKYWPGPSEFLKPIGYGGLHPTPLDACLALETSEVSLVAVEGPNNAHPNSYGCHMRNPPFPDYVIEIFTKCNDQYYVVSENPDLCRARITAVIDVFGPFPEENFGLCDGAAPAPVTGNPIHMATGNKYQHEVDYVGAGPFPLRFERHYNSQLGRHEPFSLGDKWRHTYRRRATSIENLNRGPVNTALVRPDGREHFYILSGSDWVLEESVAKGILESTVNGTLEFTDAHGNIESYDAEGRLVSISNRLGLVQTLSYDPEGKLALVTDHAGRTLAFGYDAEGRISEMTDPGGNVYRYAYDSNGNLMSVTYPDETPLDDTDNPVRTYLYEDPVFTQSLTGIIDENGVRFATWSYDASNRAILSEHAGGADRTSLVYNADGTTTVTDALGTPRVYEFDAVSGAYRINNVVGGPCATCAGSAESYTYDANGFLASRTDHNGNRTNFAHDTRGLEQSRTEAVGSSEERTITTDWHGELPFPLNVTRQGQTTTFTYDSRGRELTRTVIDTVSGSTRTVTQTYDAQGLPATRDGPRTDVSDITSFAYDAQGNLAQITNALGHVNQVTAYDPHGRPLVMVDPNGLATTLAYDARGRLLSRDVGGQLTRFNYDDVGNVTGVTMPDGNSLTFEHDEAHRLVAIVDDLGDRIEFTLDAMGNRIGETVKDPGATVVWTRSRIFDALNRLVREVGGAGEQTDFEHDPQGNQTAVIDGNGERTTSEYDGLDRLVRTIDPSLGETTLVYDARDNLITVTDPEGLATSHAYDGLDNLLTQTSPDTGLTQFTHDDAGNRLTRTDARGIVTRFHYDALNRIVEVEYPDSTKNVGFSYDSGANGIGRMSRMTDSSGSTDFSYDVRGNVISEVRTIDGLAHTILYSYDDADQLSSITYPSGMMITYTRGMLGRIESVSATIDGVQRPLAGNFTHLPFGPAKSFDLENGVALARTYDQSYRLTSQTVGSVQNISLDYDPADNIVSIVDGLDPSRSQTFLYDELDRLSLAQGIYGTEEFSYDGVGNRLTHTAAAGPDTYHYLPGSNRLDSISGPNGTGFGYDAGGNTVVEGPREFVYDDTNRMTEARIGGLTVGEYVYNGKGERVKKTANGMTTVFHYDTEGQLIAESDGSGDTIREYAYLDGAPLALVNYETAAPIDVQIDNGDSQWFSSTDHWESRTDGVGAIGGEYLRMRTKAPPAGGILSDDEDAVLSGAWKQRPKTHAIDGAFHRAKPGSGDARATWTVAIPTAGDYRVYATWKRLSGMAPDVPYTIDHVGGPTSVIVDQSLTNNEWVELGVFTFEAGATTITVDNTPNGKATVDAIYVVDANATAPHRATWWFDPPQPGEYEVYVRWPDGVSAGSKRARYRVKHDGGTDVLWINQRVDGNQWNLLGTFTFTAPGSVRLLNVRGGKYVFADSVRFVGVGASIGSAEVLTYVNDQLGAPLKLLDESGTVVWAADHAPFGVVLETVTSRSNRLRFPGQYFDPETGTHYNLFRDYDASLGRYLQSDPLGIRSGSNTYLYVGANPVRYSDALGLISEDFKKTIEHLFYKKIGDWFKDLLVDTVMEGAVLKCANSFKCGAENLPYFTENVIAKCIEILTELNFSPHMRGGKDSECAGKCKEKLRERCKEDPQACLTEDPLAAG